MRILLINQFATQINQNRLDRYFYLLKFLNDNGISAELISSSSSALKKHDKKIRIFTQIFQNKGTFQRFMCYVEFGTRLLFLKIDQDVIYCSTPNIFACLMAMCRAKLSGKKFIFEVRDIWSESVTDLTEISKHNPIFILSRWIERILILKSDLVVHTMRDFPNYAKKECIKKAEHFFYLPQIIDLNLVIRNLEQRRKNYRFVYSGSLKEKNNPMELIRGFKRFSETKPELKASLKIIGFPETNELENFSSINNLNIDFEKKFYSKKELLNKLSAYDAGIVSYKDKSVYNYGISFNKVLDYKASGLFVIYSKGDDHSSGKNTFDSLMEYVNCPESEVNMMRRINLDEVTKKHDAKENVKRLLKRIKDL